MTTGKYARTTLRGQEKVAVVGNRKGADMAQVVAFIDSLHAFQPDTLVVSGGAKGVDELAESSWFRLGGKVRSYRPAPFGDGYGIEIWNYGGSEPAHVLSVEHQRISFANYKSAAIYRDWMIAESVDRLVGFYRDNAAKLVSGAALTASLARDRGVSVYDFVAKAAA